MVTPVIFDRTTYNAVCHCMIGPKGWRSQELMHRLTILLINQESRLGKVKFI